jgi:RNA polymerase sigma-70 factor, ECF subfamily
MNDQGTATENAWHAFSDGLRAFLRSKIANDSDAEDLHQEVFLRVYQNIGSLKQSERLQAWLFQVARNAIADFYRRRTPRPEEAVEAVVDRQSIVLESANYNRALAAWLPTLIELMPDTLQEAMRLYEIDGLAQLEIARRLGISLSGAKSRIQRGRRQHGGFRF